MTKNESLRSQTITGILWFLGQSGIMRLVNLAGNVVLAWLLLPEDFGLIGIAYGVKALVSILTNNGVEKILVARQRDFDDLASPAFWFDLCCGLISGVLLILIAPSVGEWYMNDRLASLLILLAISVPFGSLVTVPKAKLNIDLNYGTLATLETVAPSIQTVLTMLFAWMGTGVYSFIIPTLIVLPIKAGIYFFLAPIKLRKGLDLKKWPEMTSLSWMIFSVAIINIGIEQGDYLIAGRYFEKDTVGLYFLAFSFSIQTFALLTQNVITVLFPAFCKIGSDHARRRTAFVHAIRLVSWIAIPSCLTIAAVAEPLVKVMYEPRWYGMIPILQILAIGMSFRPLGALTAAFLQAETKYLHLLKVNVLRGLLFVVGTLIATRFGILWFAVAVATPYVVGPLANFYLIMRNATDRRNVFRTTIVVPLGASALCAALIRGAIEVVQPESRVENSAVLGMGFLFGFFFSAMTMRFVAASAFTELIAVFKAALKTHMWWIPKGETIA